MKRIKSEQNLPVFCAKWCLALLFVPITCLWAVFFFDLQVGSEQDTVLEIVHLYVVLCMGFVISQTVKSKVIIFALFLAVVNSAYDALTEILFIHTIIVGNAPVLDAIMDEGLSITAYFLVTYGVYQLFKKVQHDSMIDELTGVYSRSAIELIPVDEYEIFYLDLDKFKEVNDTFGHDHGDKVLLRFSNNLTGACQDYGYIVRIGGDEFVAVINSDFKDKFISRLHQLCDIHSINFSYGSATYCNQSGFHETLKRADLMLYKMKAERKNAMVF